MQWIYWLIAIITSLAAGYWVFLADKRREVTYPWLTALLRTVVIFLALLLVLAPAMVITRNETKKPIILFLQDNSASIAMALGKDSIAYQKNATALTEKLSDQYQVVRWGFGNTIQNDSIFQYKQQATDIAAALTRAQEFYGTQNLGAIVLATDGRFNEGSNPVYQQLALHSPVYVAGIGDTAMQKDLRIAQVYANKTATLNSQFEIRADLLATLCKGYDNNAQLSEGGNSLGTATIAINADRYDRSVSFSIKADKPGLHHYTITVPVAAGESNTANNKRDLFVEVVDEKKNILIAAAATHPDINAIKEALSGMENYKVTVAIGNDIPSINNYQVIILHQTPGAADNKLMEELRSARKPVWYILGSQTNVPLLTPLRKPATISGNPVTSNVFAAYNKGFNSFTLPQDLQAVLDKMPPLDAITNNLVPTPNTNILFYQRGAEQVPVWILQQGNPPMAMLTGEGLWRWRLYEYRYFNRHEVVDECIRQTLSFLSVNNEKPFRVALPKYIWSDQEPVTLNAYLLNANNEQVNSAEVQLSIADSAGRKQNFSFERSGNAYRINIGIWAGGNYTYSAKTIYNGITYTATGSFVVQTLPLEAMETGADYPLLYGLATKYNGSFVPASNISSLYDTISKNQNIKPVIQENVETVPLVGWKWYFFLILLFAVTEWLLRKYWLAQ